VWTGDWTIVKLEATTAQAADYSAQSVDFNKDVRRIRSIHAAVRGTRHRPDHVRAAATTPISAAGCRAQGFTLLTPSYVPAGDELTA